jgi:hypothetical protein
MTSDFVQARSTQEAPPATTQPPAARPSREELRQQILDAMQAAKEAAQQAQAEQQAVTVQRPPPPFGPLPDQGIPENVLILMIVLAALTAATLIFRPLMLALGRRFERRGGPPPETPDMAPRLDRIEQAIEAIAVELERISEGQRYVTKQMHDLRALPAPNPLAQPAMSQRAPETVRRGESGGGA